MLLLCALIWIFCGIGAALVAQGRGANGCLWFGLGALFGPFGLAFAFASGTDRRCPNCRERIHPEASRCPKCQADLSMSQNAAMVESRTAATERTSALASDNQSNSGFTTKKCPDCAEDVRVEARKCRFCGFLFPEPITAELQPEPPIPEAGATEPQEDGQPILAEPEHSVALDEQTWNAWKNEPKSKSANYPWGLLAIFTVPLWLFGYFLFTTSKANDSSKATGGITQIESAEQNPVEVESPKKRYVTGRTEKTLLGRHVACVVIEDLYRNLVRLSDLAPGCNYLEYGTKVIGPLEVKIIRHASISYLCARIDVPGKGERWTFFDSLKK